MEEATSVETPDGRILSGVGVSEESLQETVDARTPKAPDSPGDGRPARTDVGPAASVQPDVQADAPPVAAVPDAPVEEPDTYHRDEKTGQFKKISAKKRLDQLTWERENARREAQTERERVAELQRRLDALEQSRTSAEPARAATSSEPPRSAATRPKPSVNLVGTTYPTYEDYVEDLADWKAEQRAVELQHHFDALIRTRIEADQETRTFATKVDDLHSQAREAYPDFDAVIATSQVQFPAPILQAIIDHPSSIHVQYQLAKDQTLASRIAAMTNPFQVGYELAKLGPPSSNAPSASLPRGTTTAAPPPMQPVGSGSKTTVPPLEDLAANGGDDYDKSGYRERRAAERKAVGRR